MHIFLKPRFSKLFQELPNDLQKEVLEKLELFRNPANHKVLRVHKLHGKMKDCYSFSITYSLRVVFRYEDKTKSSAVLLAIGDHEVYN